MAFGINKRLISSLLGGGVCVTLGLLSYGGVKVGEKIHYDGQVRHFGGLRSEFIGKLVSETQFKDQTMPKWEDIKLWERYFKENKDSTRRIVIRPMDGQGADIAKQINSPEELRDACYEALTDKMQGFEKCNPTLGWCLTCLFKKGYYGTSQQY